MPLNKSNLAARERDWEYLKISEVINSGGFIFSHIPGDGLTLCVSVCGGISVFQLPQHLMITSVSQGGGDLSAHVLNPGKVNPRPCV